jgi:head-tail adaptor
MNKRLTHPKLMDSLFRFFNKVCDIEEWTETGRDEYNEPIYEWSPKYSGIGCIIGSDKTEEQKQDKYNSRIVTHRIVLNGNFTDIDDTMRLNTSDGIFDIVNAPEDILGVKTSIKCRKAEV